VPTAFEHSVLLLYRVLHLDIYFAFGYFPTFRKIVFLLDVRGFLVMINHVGDANGILRRIGNYLFNETNFHPTEIEIRTPLQLPQISETYSFSIHA